jgi:Bacteriophage head to tail connecting protein.
MTVDGMTGYMCSRNQPWFALQLPSKMVFPRSSILRGWSGKRLDEFPEVQRWLQNTQEEMYLAFNQSNFYDIVPEFIGDGVSIGTGYMLIEEDVDSAKLAFLVPHFRECFVAENRYGKVDTLYRVYKITLRQLATKFDWDELKKIDNNLENRYKSNMHEEVEILHAVYPRQDYTPWRIDLKGKQWESVYLYRKSGKLMAPLAAIGSPEDQSRVLSLKEGEYATAEGGYDSFPYIAWRWRKNNDEIYGRGCGHDAWISIALDNQMGRTNLKTGQRAAEPPLVAYSDLRGAIQKDADGITFVESNRGDIRTRAPMPLYAGGVQNLPFSIEYQDKVKAVINKHFHTDVFMLLTQLAQNKASERMVTEQVFELMNEKAAVLGTRVGNLQSEAFDPLIRRVYSIESKARRTPPPPDILLQTIHGPVEIQYLGPLAQAQTRLSKVRSIQTGLQLTEQAAKILGPECADYINKGETMKDIFNSCGFPAKDTQDDKMVMQIQQQRNKIQEQERQAEQAPKIARAIATMQKTTEKGSPLAALTGGGGEGG